jgi:2'-5' RNA ligase
LLTTDKYIPFHLTIVIDVVYMGLVEQEKRFEQIWQRSVRALSKNGVPESTPVTADWTEDKRMLAFWILLNDREALSRNCGLHSLASRLHELDSSFIPLSWYNYHIHLKRGSIVKEEDVEKITSEIMAKIEYLPPLHYLHGLDLRIKGIGVFPTTIFAQVYDLNGSLYKLHQYLVRKLDGEKSQPFEGPDYIPHIALGRLKPGTKTKKLISSLKEIREEGFLDYGLSTHDVVFVKSYGYKPESEYKILTRFSI